MLTTTDVKNGLWIRTISNIPRELRILIKRKEYTDAEWKLTHTPIARENSLFTPYSPAHFMVEGLPSYIFSNDDAGIIFRHVYRPIHFYDGCSGERLTRSGDGDLNYDQEELDNGKGREHQLRFPSSQQMKKLLETRYKELANDSYYKENPTERPCLCWNEGLLRYSFKDIRGIYVNLQKKNSCQNALLLRKMLSRVGGVKPENLKFYEFEGGHYRYTPTNKVTQVIGNLHASCHNYSPAAAQIFSRVDAQIKSSHYDAVSLDSLEVGIGGIRA